MAATGRREETEIEITPEMIEAGADVIRSRDLDSHRAVEIAEEVFRTMLSCRSHAAARNESMPRMRQK